MPDPLVTWLQQIQLAQGDRDALKRLRRRVRADRSLPESMRRELLESAGYSPGCCPQPLELVELRM